ncbi:MAG: DUF1926 domain-containing protein [Spirochaetales bacterium]|nr:DUF1926 domain-containing protein [Spirochaetales bacterium]
MKGFRIIFGTHNSQPVGNFSDVMEEVYQKSYKPFLSVLNQYPEFPVTLHYSGALLEWLDENHSEFLMLLGEMVKRKQVELIGGGFYQPILSMLTNHDRLGQIEKMTTFLRANFGKRPRGLWLYERVWDTNHVTILDNCGIEFTFLDENHFYAAGLDKADLFYPHITEDQGKVIKLFAINKDLRYMIPSREPEEIINYCRNLPVKNGSSVITLFDNGEKFGAWKDSYDRCYNKGWFPKFIETILQNQDWLKPELPSSYLKKARCKNKIYIPNMIYEEMQEWARCPKKRRKSKNTKPVSRNNGTMVYAGSTFKNFFRKYSESNLMYSKMMYVNILANQIRGDKYKKRAAKEELWKGQCNNAYWHGLSGGIYYNHLRKNVYRALIEAEEMTRVKGVFLPSIVVTDFDMDGRDEYLYQGSKLNAYIHSQSGVLFELDYFPIHMNYQDTLSRHLERYHDDHFKEQGIDNYPRSSFIDRFFDKELKLEDVIKSKYTDMGSFYRTKYELADLDREHLSLSLFANGFCQTANQLHNLSIRKKYIFEISSLQIIYEIRNTGLSEFSGHFGTEINLGLPSDKSHEREMLVYSGSRSDLVTSQKGSYSAISAFSVKDFINETKLKISSDKPSELWFYDVYTHSRNFDLFDRIYQGTCLVPRFEINLAPGEVWSNSFSLNLRRNYNKR